MSSAFLSVPVLESLALSSSSSSSASSMFGTDLGTSDSQTDFSPPHSPPKYPLRGENTRVFSSKFLLDNPIQPDFDSALNKTPRALEKSRLDINDDTGYDSEREGYSNSSVRTRPRVLTRKKTLSTCYLGLGLVNGPVYNEILSSEIKQRKASLSNLRPVARRDSNSSYGSAFIQCEKDKGSNSTSSESQGTGFFEPMRSYATDMCPPKPRLLPVLIASSPSPILPLPSPISAMGDNGRVFLVKPCLGPQLFSEEMSPIDDLPPLLYSPGLPTKIDPLGLFPEDVLWVNKITDSTIEFPEILEMLPQTRNRPTTTCDQASGVCGSVHLSGILATGLGLELGPPQYSIRLEGVGSHGSSLQSEPPIGPLAPQTNASNFDSENVRRTPEDGMKITMSQDKRGHNGLGVGLPSGLGPRTHLQRASRIINSPPFSQTGATKRRGIISGTRSLFELRSYPRRRLFDIPELSSLYALRQKEKSLAAPLSMGVECAKPLKLSPDCSHPFSNNIWGSTAPQARQNTLHPPLGRSASVPELYSRNAHHSPVLIHLDVPQKLKINIGRHIRTVIDCGTLF